MQAGRGLASAGRHLSSILAAPRLIFHTHRASHNRLTKDTIWYNIPKLANLDISKRV